MAEIRMVDKPVLLGFLLREAKDYRFRDTVSGEEKYAELLFNDVEKELSKVENGDMIRVVSVSNMGQEERSLELSITPYKFGENYMVLLPTSPRDNITFGKYKRTTGGIYDMCSSGTRK